MRKKNKWLLKIHTWIKEHGGGIMIPFSVEFEEERWALRDDVDGLKAFDDAAEGAKTALPKMVVQAGGEEGRGRHACTAIVQCAITTPRIFFHSRFFIFSIFFFFSFSGTPAGLHYERMRARSRLSLLRLSSKRARRERGRQAARDALAVGENVPTASRRVVLLHSCHIFNLDRKAGGSRRIRCVHECSFTQPGPQTYARRAREREKERHEERETPPNEARARMFRTVFYCLNAVH